MVTKQVIADPELVKFDDYLRFGTDEERSKDTNTRSAYVYTIQLFKHFLDGKKPNTDQAKAFIKYMEEKGNVASSINRHIWALKSYFRFLTSMLPSDVSEVEKLSQHLRIRGLKTPERLPRFLKDKEWEKLLGVASAPIYDPLLPDAARRKAKKELALVYAFCGAGLRLSEAIHLKLTDIMPEGYLRVIRKGGKEDFIPVEEEVMRVFKDYLTVRVADGQYLFSGKEPDTAMARRTAQGIIKALCRRAGLNDAHVHSLRHTAGYQLRKGGAEERDIQDVLGHKNISTTKIYTHLTNEDLKKRLPQRFNKARQGRLDWSGPNDQAG